MKTRYIYSARRALLRAVLAVLTLPLCELAAGSSGLRRSVGTALAILGYLFFVLLIRSALLSWRRDWDSLWRESSDLRSAPRVVLFSKHGPWKAASRFRGDPFSTRRDGDAAALEKLARAVRSIEER